MSLIAVFSNTDLVDVTISIILYYCVREEILCLEPKKPLTDTEIRKAKPKEKEYPLSDGNGLILRVNPNGSKIWLFNYYHPVTKKRTNAGLGMYPQIQLSDARAKREEYRALLAKGIDP